MSRLWAVTGATGLLGNNLVRTLVARGERVRVLVRGGATRPELAGVPLTIADGSLDSPLERCFDGADVVVHAAAQVRIGRRDADIMHRVNVDGTRAVCAAVERCGARLVHVSSVDGLGLRSLAHPADETVAPRRKEEVAPYITTKRAADAVVRASATDHVIVHPTFMLGPYDWKPSSGTMLRAIARGQGRIAPPGANNFVHVQDVVHGIIAAADGPRGRSWILGNENLTYREAWSLFARVTGGPAPVATLPPAAVAPVAAALDLAWTVVGWLGVPEADLNGPAVRMGSKPHVFDPSRARVELGLPATPVEQAARDAWDWMRRDPRGATFSGTASPA